jgi:hypothetical protein
MMTGWLKSEPALTPDAPPPLPPPDPPAPPPTPTQMSRDWPWVTAATPLTSPPWPPCPAFDPAALVPPAPVASIVTLETPAGTVHCEQPACVNDVVSAAAGAAAISPAISAPASARG